MADAQDSDSCELKLHVGSTPIRRTIFYCENKYFYGVITDKKSKWESKPERVRGVKNRLIIDFSRVREECKRSVDERCRPSP